MTSVPTTDDRKRETLNLRIKPEERRLIDQAAAEEALLDRAIISTGPDAYAAFLTRLDRPAQPNDRLRETMRIPAPWVNRSP